MKLLLKITAWLAMAFTVLLAVWAVCFYFATTDEINDETDDSLIDYSDALIIRKLAGVELPEGDNGTNNTYYIKEVTAEAAESRPWIMFENREIFMSSKSEFESARVLSRIFRDSQDRFYELTVAVPTFEKDDIQRSILWWVVALYVVLLLSVLCISVWVVGYNMRPLKAMLQWLDDYNPGKKMPPVPSDTNVTEFRKLADTIRNAAARFDVQYQEQKHFIGNASHELQTPLAACSNRIEMLLDSPDLTAVQTEELAKVHRGLQELVRLNRTLLLLTKIENGQFPETSEIDFSSLAADAVEMFGEIYPSRRISVIADIRSPFVYRMNPQLASILLRNLLKNAILHSDPGSDVSLVMSSGGFSVANPGSAPLDGEKIFSRFYHSQSQAEGSTGLGLAIADSICRSYGLALAYSFSEGKHVFSVSKQESGPVPGFHEFF